MDQIGNFHRLFAYDGWANLEVLSGLRAVTISLPRTLMLMAHILSSQRLWMERLQQKPQTFPVWPEFTAEQCQQQASELPVLWRNYLASSSETELARPVSYRNSKGETWSSRKDDILMHLITHSAYHRGQVAMAVRAAGLTPAYTDFIHSVRQGFVK
ncbi:MAG: DinB family protein [Terriglobales bacterium]